MTNKVDKLRHLKSKKVDNWKIDGKARCVTVKQPGGSCNFATGLLELT